MPLVNKTFSDIITFSRGSNATMFDSSGTLVYAPNNAIRNNTMVGAVAGTPGTLPTNWGVFTALTGLTREIVGSGTENGITYIDLRVSGTPSGAGSYNFYTETATGVAALNGQTWTNSAYFKLQAGSLTGITAVRLFFQENNSGGGYLTEQNTAITNPTSAALNTQRASASRTLNQATTAFLLPGFNLLLSGAAIDITLRIGLPQLEIGPVATAVNPTSGTAYYGPRLDYDPATLAARGLLIEEQRTNSIRNNTMQGAVAGTPGTAPTNWLRFVSGTAATSVVGTGIENGITYIDVAFSGGNTDGISFFVDGNIGHAALNGQTWTGSAYYKLTAGSFANCVINHVVYEANSSGTALAASSITLSTVTSAALSTQRVVVTRTNNNASTAEEQLAVVIAGTGAFSFTLRIGLPQLELGAFATSVIPTTTTALTRSADVASVNTLSPWYNATEGTIYAEFLRNTTPAASTFPQFVNIDDGSANNRLALSTNLARNLRGQVAIAGVFTTIATANAYTEGSVSKLALGYQALNHAAVANGGVAATDTSVNVPSGLTTMRLGDQAGGAGNVNGYLRRITYYPRRLSNAELQAITA